MVAAGTFRSDLYYRLNVFPITLPPLRERPRGHPASGPLLRAAVRAPHEQAHRAPSRPTPMAALRGYDWPGNVRELENAIERAVILTTGPVASACRSPSFRPAPSAARPADTLEATEREAILRSAARDQRGARRSARRRRPARPQADDAAVAHAQARHRPRASFRVGLHTSHFCRGDRNPRPLRAYLDTWIRVPFAAHGGCAEADARFGGHSRPY